MRKKPTELKRLEGTLRRDRTNLREPKPPKLAAGGAPQRRLPLGVRREFAVIVRLLEPMNVVTVSDIAMLELVAAAGDEYWRAHRVVARLGTTYETVNAAGSRMFRSRPEVAIAADAWRRYSAGLERFGLSPSSRPKVEADAPRPVDDLDAFLARRTAAGAARAPDRFFSDVKKRDA